MQSKETKEILNDSAKGRRGRTIQVSIAKRKASFGVVVPNSPFNSGGEENTPFAPFSHS